LRFTVVFVTIPFAEGRGVTRAPGVALVICYVVLVGNQWVSEWLAVSFAEGEVPLSSVVTFPRWRVTPQPGNEWNFWVQDLRAVLFAGLMVFGLRRLARSSLGAGAFPALVGTTVLTASLAAVGGAFLTSVIVGQPNRRNDWDYLESDFFDNLVLTPLFQATLFGLLFGVALGAFTAREYRNRRPGARTNRHDNEPLSLW
jgi:hypothetical protein